MRESKRALAGRVPLIGFSGSPFTLACYMVEGAGSDDWRTLKTMLHTRPDLLHRILEVNARAVADYLNAQIEAGADAVMLFDTWGGMLAHDDYEAFSLALLREKSSKKCTKVPDDPVHQRRKSVARRDDAERMRPRSDWTGRATRARRANWPPDASRCREIWIRPRCLRRLNACAKLRARCSIASAPRRAMSSISATAFSRKHLWNPLPRL